MRRVIRLAVVVCVLWSGWWALASYGAKRGVEALFDARQVDGWRGTVQQSGFPFRIKSHLNDVLISSAENQMAVKMTGLTFSVPTYWPGYLTLYFPDTPIVVQTPVSDITIEAPQALANLRVHPNTALTLESLKALTGPWQMSIGAEDVIFAEDLTFDAYQNADLPTRYDVTLNAPELTPGVLLRKLLGLSPDWPETFEEFDVDASVTLNSPLDRHTDQIVVNQIEVRRVQIRWGVIGLAAQGTVKIDKNGVPDGRVDVQITQWRQLLDLAQGAGALPPNARRQAELLLSALANLEGDPQDLDLSVGFTNGRMALGPIDLGPAPRLR